jgi:trk system potassium uptake protein
LARQDHRLPGVAVIGLGRFGRALALELESGGTEVLGIDANSELVQSLSGQLTHLVVADSTKEEALRQLSVHEFEQVVVGIGSDIEASILTTSLVLGFGVPERVGQGDQRRPRKDPPSTGGRPCGLSGA